MNIVKLFIIIGVTFIVFVTTSYLAITKGLLLHPKGIAWAMLGVAYAIIVFKAMMGFFASNDIEFARYGHDLCVLTVGLSLQMAVLQAAGVDLLPGISPKGYITKVFENISPTISIQHLYFILACGTLSGIFSLITAAICYKARNISGLGFYMLSLFNAFIGSLVFVPYIVVTLAKS